MSLAVEVIRFLDILIAVGKTGRGREEGRSCPVTGSHIQPGLFCFLTFPLLSHSLRTQNNRRKLSGEVCEWLSVTYQTQTGGKAL